jgi:hypothetical protein
VPPRELALIEWRITFDEQIDASSITKSIAQLDQLDPDIRREPIDTVTPYR